MLEKLTPEQEARLPEIRDEWLNIGLSCEPTDREAAEAGVRLAYERAGLEPPKIVIWLDNPLHGAIGAAMLAQVGDQVQDQVQDQVRGQVRTQVGGQVLGQVLGQVRGQVWTQVLGQVLGQVQDQVRDQVRGQVQDQVRGQVWTQVLGQVRGQVLGQVRDQVQDQVRGQVGDQVYRAVYGSHEAGWLSFYAAFAELGIAAADQLDGISAVAKACGWWWPFKGAVILTERTSYLHRDRQGRLHCEDGPAIGWGQWSFNAWHGVRVPDDFHDWTVERALTEANSEVRRCAFERIGWDALTDRLTLVASADDPGNPGFTVDLYDGELLAGLYPERARILLVSNASLDKGGHRRRFGLPVPASHTDPIAAAAELFDIPRAAYAGLARAS